MEIAESKRDGTVILGVEGRVDASNADVLEEKLLGLIAAGERQLVLDCARLDYISSAGLRVLLVAAKRLSPAGGRIAVCALQEQIKHIFEIAGLPSIFSIYATAGEAIAAR